MDGGDRLGLDESSIKDYAGLLALLDHGFGLGYGNRVAADLLLKLEFLLDYGGEILVGSAEVALVHLGDVLLGAKNELEVGDEDVCDGHCLAGVGDVSHGGFL